MADNRARLRYKKRRGRRAPGSIYGHIRRVEAIMFKALVLHQADNGKIDARVETLSELRYRKVTSPSPLNTQP